MNDEDAEFATAIGGLFAKHEAAKREAGATYRRLKSRGGLNDARALVLRCPRRCTLLEIFATSTTPILRQPPYVLSPHLNEATSNASGRAAHTTDGHRRWAEQISPLVPGFNVVLACRHVHRTLPWDELAALIESRTPEVTIPG